MSYEPQLHQTQAIILRKLLFNKNAGFASLQKDTSLTSDHFTFHIKKLVDDGYVEKVSGGYSLTVRGKEYANRMDTDENEIERQPKVSIAITLERKGENGQREFLFQQRKKNPYFDFWGRVGGKMRWGETIIEAAERELLEETGLTADLSYRLLYHKRDFDKATGKLLEDKIFLCVYANSYNGELNESFEGGVNKWMTHEEFQNCEKRFKSVDEFKELIDKGVSFAEREFYYDASEY
jgi:ADP-ribose pyrophosphatase YjhB (NUDIX family)